MNKITFISLPTELHYSISEYLTPKERRNLSHCCNIFLEIYRPLVYKYCKTLQGEQEKNNDLAVPLDVIHSTKYSWFPKAHVLSIEIGEEESDSNEYYSNKYNLAIQDKYYPALGKIKFCFAINYEEKFFKSLLFKSLQRFIDKNDQFNLEVFYQIPIQIAMSDLTSLDFPINHSNITRLFFLEDCFSPTYVTFIPDISFPCLEYVKIRNFCCEDTDSETSHDLQNNTLFMNRICTMLLQIIARSSKLKSVNLDIQRLKYSSCQEILKNGVAHLPSDLEECHIKIAGSTYYWWKTVPPDIDKNDIQEFPQVTSLNMIAFITLFQQYRFPRAERVLFSYNYEEIQFSNFHYSLDSISYLKLSIKDSICYHSRLIKILPYLQNVKELEVGLQVDRNYYFEKPIVDDLVECAKKVVQSCLSMKSIPKERELKFVITEMSKRSMKQRFLSKYKNGIRTNDLTSNLLQLYSDPISYLLTIPGVNFFEETNPYVVLCFQEALYLVISRLPKLEYFAYKTFDRIFSPSSILDFYPCLPCQSMPSLSLQKLVGPVSGNKSVLKQIFIEHSSNFGNDDIKYLTTAQKMKFNLGQIEKVGTFDQGKLIFSLSQQLAPRPSKVYTFKHDKEKNHGISFLFDFRYFNNNNINNNKVKNVTSTHVLVTDLNLKSQFNDNNDWLSSRFDGWV